MSAAPPRHPPSTRTAILLALLALFAVVAAALGTAVLVRADAGLAASGGHRWSPCCSTARCTAR
ncbi:hypothetical protein ACLQ24_21450 [Micromonospora sp. DT4]|uniref:hypothetical protein n=1 Tax=Micromonospora sp. DT4 TaxID=3393438 RepID=UPI003CEF1203